MTEIEWPQMSRVQQEECVRLIEMFKKKMLDAASDVMSTFYCDILPHIESDTFLNFRKDAMSAVKGYSTRYALGPDDYEGLQIRERIYKDYQEEIVKLIDNDNIKRIRDLEEQLKQERDYNRRGY